MSTQVKRDCAITSRGQRFHSVAPSMSRLATTVRKQDRRLVDISSNTGGKPISISAHQAQFSH
jgi:hypothetical protein